MTIKLGGMFGQSQLLSKIMELRTTRGKNCVRAKISLSQNSKGPGLGPIPFICFYLLNKILQLTNEVVPPKCDILVKQFFAQLDRPFFDQISTKTTYRYRQLTGVWILAGPLPGQTQCYKVTKKCACKSQIVNIILIYWCVVNRACKV